MMFGLKENNMRKLFTPNYYIHRYDALRVDVLKEQHITLLLCDIDNTLVPHDIAIPDNDVLIFLKGIQDAGIRIIFISNNVEERVMRFAEHLDIDCYPFAMKPLSKTYRRILKDTNVNKKQVAMLGDQMMTDMLGANLMGFYTILTAPVVERDLKCTKINRMFENMVFTVLKRMGRLKKGEFNE